MQHPESLEHINDSDWPWEIRTMSGKLHQVRHIERRGDWLAFVSNGQATELRIDQIESVTCMEPQPEPTDEP